MELPLTFLSSGASTKSLPIRRALQSRIKYFVVRKKLVFSGIVSF